MANTRMLVVAAGIGLVALSAQASGGRAQTAEQKVRAAEAQLHDAYVQRNTSLYAKLCADEATFVTSDGRIVRTQDRLKLLRENPVPETEDEVVQVRVYGDSAVVTGYTSYNRNGRLFSYTMTRMWVKHEDHWQLVAYQSTLRSDPRD